MDKQYSSQPKNKPSKWILSKCRTLKSNTEGSSDQHHENVGPVTKGHVEGWVDRLIKWRFRELQKNPCLNLRWTILPPSFVSFYLKSI
ncbi:hypothetical protein R6Q57_023752 [Mikania cordata]